ncbi:MAG: hypothetical protein HC873_07585 [Leptolyngbyaceae cyanobacterium SL_1_1]|nr:hypothetical protein [Leptolyngbyaceae cyanobacterium SL_1_1]
MVQRLLLRWVAIALGLAIAFGVEQVQAQQLPYSSNSAAVSALSAEVSNTASEIQEAATAASDLEGVTYPTWEVLVLIYQTTDFSYTDSEGLERHAVANLTPDEVFTIATTAKLFFDHDVPLLTSGMQKPKLTIRYPDHPLTELDAFFCGYWPDMANTAADRDPNFDSVIVVWDDSGTDLYSGMPTDLMVQCGAVTQPNGTGRTYTTIAVDSTRSRRNSFKHEWGHAILFYFEATGTAPQPAVNNHINDTDTRYVNCLTGASYILQDETEEQPIPNSIYNNESGFTHDYYSGLAATPDQPNRCLGISSATWRSPPPTQLEDTR